MSAAVTSVAGLVDEAGVVAGHRLAARARALLALAVGQEDVQRLARADAVEHRVAEAGGEAALQVGRQGLAGGDRRPHRARTWTPGRSVSSRPATKPGLAKNSVGCSVRDELGDLGRGRPAGVEDRRGADRERERQRVAEPEGEEQLGDRQAAVVGSDREHLAGVRLGGGLRAAVAVHDALRRARRARAVEPERGRVLGGRRNGRLVGVGEVVPRVGRAPCRAAAGVPITTAWRSSSSAAARAST